MVIQKCRGVYFNSKVLNLDDADLSKSLQQSYILLVEVCVDYF